jgi:type I restriction enzyme, S subunit
MSAEWLTRTIGELCDKPQYGYTASASSSQIGPRFLRITDLQNGTLDWRNVPFCECEENERDKYRLNSGDIVVARIGATTGRTSLVLNPPDSVFASYLIRLRPGNEVNPFYLFFFTQSHAYKSWIDGNKDNNLKGGVNASVLTQIEVPFPEKGEQEKIAAVLWKIQRAIEVEEKLTATARELKQAAMRQLFTHGLRDGSQQETEIGPIPESWKPRSILELCEIWSGGTPRKSNAEYWCGNIPWVSGKDLKTPALDDAIDHISIEGVESGSRLAPQSAILLLVRGMGLAKDLPVAVINCPMAFNQDVKALVSRGEYSGQFLRSAIYAGKERLLSRIVPSAHGTMTLNLDDVENFKVACPSDPNEATEIVTIFSALDHKISLHSRKLIALQDLFKTTLHKLMTGAIRVADLEIDTSEVTA